MDVEVKRCARCGRPHTTVGRLCPTCFGQLLEDWVAGTLPHSLVEWADALLLVLATLALV